MKFRHLVGNDFEVLELSNGRAFVVDILLPQNRQKHQTHDFSVQFSNIEPDYNDQTVADSTELLIEGHLLISQNSSRVRLVKFDKAKTKRQRHYKKLGLSMLKYFFKKMMNKPIVAPVQHAKDNYHITGQPSAEI